MEEPDLRVELDMEEGQEKSQNQTDTGSRTVDKDRLWEMVMDGHADILSSMQEGTVEVGLLEKGKEEEQGISRGQNKGD